MNIPLKAISLSHKNASLEVREQFAMNSCTSRSLLQYAKELGRIDEMLVISTCNRFEVYFWSNSVDCQQLIALLKLFAPNLEHDTSRFQLFEESLKATEHLFSVSVGLESQVLGDSQIINQVKMAYQHSCDLNMAGLFLHRLLHAIFRTHKRITQETRFKDCNASVAQTTKKLVQKLLPNKNDKILILGIGKVGTALSKKLSKSGYDVWISNRTEEKSGALAAQLDLKSVPFNHAHLLLDKVGLVISTLSVEEPYLSKKNIKPSCRSTHRYFIDLSVPRSIAPELADEPNITLLNMDHIHDEISLTVQKRIDEVPKVQAIINDELSEYFEWAKQLKVQPTIHKMKAALEKIRQEEIARHLKHFDLEERDLINDITKNIVARVIKLPVVQLKMACKRGEDAKITEVLNEIFNI